MGVRVVTLPGEGKPIRRAFIHRRREDTPRAGNGVPPTTDDQPTPKNEIAEAAMNPMKRSILTLTILSLVAATPVWADQAMGPEIPISVLDNQQYNPHVAYNSIRDQYLVVWQNFWGGSRDIYGRRLDGEGNLLSYFTISTGTFDRVQPAVAYDPLNDRYLVVWSYDFHGNGSDWDLYGRLIPWNGPDGGLTEFPIETSTRTQDSSEVAFALAQQEFMVVWNNRGGGVPIDIEGARMQLNGNLIPGGLVLVASGATDRTNPDIAYNLDRNEYLVTYDDLGANILATRLTGNGVILGGGEFGIATWPSPESKPSVAACGGGTDRYFVAWQSQVSATNNDVYGRFVTGDGVPDGAPLRFPYHTMDEQEPEVTCRNGSAEFLVVWEEQYSTGAFGIRGSRVFPNGTLSFPFAVRPVWVGETGVATMPAAVGGEQGYLVVWEHDRQGTSYQDIHGKMVWGPLFADGFESGNTNAWSAVSP